MSAGEAAFLKAVFKRRRTTPSIWVPITRDAGLCQDEDGLKVTVTPRISCFFGRRGSQVSKFAQQVFIWAFQQGAEMARIDQTDDWRDRHAPTLSAFESLAIEAYGHLPEEFRALTKDLIIEIADFPTDDVFEDMALETPFDLLGLFEGRGISERFTMETGEMVNRITLYRRPILDYWAENEETLGDIITHVLIHEIGHHFGLSDDDMERIEESADEAAADR